MNNRRRREWHTQLSKLPPHVAALADKAFALFVKNPGHPSLRFDTMGYRRRADTCVEVTITMDYRTVAYVDGDTYVWFWIGTHNDFNTKFGK